MGSPTCFRGSVHHSVIQKENLTRCNSVSYFIYFIYIYEAQHVSEDTPPIIRSLKLHYQPLVCTRGGLLDM